MIDVLLTLVGIFLVLLLNEYLWRAKILHGEAARKFMHILIGVWGAFWPFYMSWGQIRTIGLVAMGFILFMRLTPYFKSVFDVSRRTWGDVIGPATIVLLTLFEPSVWVFTAAVLHIALADGFAAIAGTKYGKKNQYKIIGNTKSLVGTTVFWIISFSILAAGAMLSQVGLHGLTLPILLWLSAGAAYLENVSPMGFDNLLVPMLIFAVLEPLQLAI